MLNFTKDYIEWRPLSVSFLICTSIKFTDKLARLNWKTLPDTMDPRVQFSLPKSYYKQKFIFDILPKNLLNVCFLKKKSLFVCLKFKTCMPKFRNVWMSPVATYVQTTDPNGLLCKIETPFTNNLWIGIYKLTHGLGKRPKKSSYLRNYPKLGGAGPGFLDVFEI